MPAVKSEALPLDEKIETYHNPVTGMSQPVPMLDSKWIEQENVEFINYVPPPVKANLLTQTAETDENEILTWEERAHFINNDLKWLLCQSHSQFWNQVIFNKSINCCLDSFLKLSPRSFDVWKFLPERILNLQKQMHRSIFMVYLRMSTNKESKKDFFTPTVFGDILYENFLFDIPKIMDLCSLYGGEHSGNTRLLTKMLENIFNRQPKYVDDLQEMIPSIFEIFEQIEQEVGGTPNGVSSQATEESVNQNAGGHKTRNVDEIVLYLFDTCQTLLSLFQTHPSLCQHFFKVGLVQRVAAFWEEIMPVLSQRYRGLSRKTARDFLKRCKVDMIKMCHCLINASCLDPLINCDKEIDEESKESCVEDFLSVVSELLSFKHYHEIELDLGIIRRCGPAVDETRLQYITSAIQESNSKSHQKSRLNPVANKPSNAINGDETSEEPMACTREPSVEITNVSDEQLRSMVSHVKDLLPDCGEGFIKMCLRKLNYDIEKTINLIFEDGLPPELQCIDRRLSQVDITKKSSESDVLAARHSIFDNDEFDVFSNADVDLSRVHKGKSRVTDNVKTVLGDKKDIETVKEFVLNYDEHFNDYEDEYDDTYDTHDVGAQDIISADELSDITLRRAFTTPIVLRNMGGASDDEDMNPDTEKWPTTDSGETSKDNAAFHRNKARGGHTGAPGGKRNYETGKNKERDRSYKDKNKAKIANHNRKAGAAKKQARGMAF